MRVRSQASQVGVCANAIGLAAAAAAATAAVERAAVFDVLVLEAEAAAAVVLWLHPLPSSWHPPPPS